MARKRHKIGADSAADNYMQRRLILYTGKLLPWDTPNVSTQTDAWRHASAHTATD